MNITELLSKAERAEHSAKLLLEAEDYDGASNRAYYAMFDAAKAALKSEVDASATETIRTHNGLIAVFSQHIVKTGKMPVEAGRNLNRVEEIRLTADYKGDSIDPEQAAWAVQQATQFITLVKALIKTA